MTSVATILALVLSVCLAQAARDCIFLHGSGETSDSPPTTSFSSYWGDMPSATPQCASWTFNHADTTTRRFDDPTLMQMYCEVATGNATGGVILNKIVFTHSMGNAVLAAALRAGVCGLDSSSSWYLSAPPAFGSKAANVVEKICTSSSWEEAPLRDLAIAMHYCQNDQPGPANEAYLSMQTTDPSLVGLDNWMLSYASGIMCGTSDFGLTSEYSLEFEALAAIVEYGEDNDGMVAISSCQIGNSTWPNWGSDASSPFYIAAINHADATGRNGNGDFGANRQPLEWFSNRN